MERKEKEKGMMRHMVLSLLYSVPQTADSVAEVDFFALYAYISVLLSIERKVACVCVCVCV